MTQQGDVLLFQTIDDGEINVESGLVEMTAGFETAAYLALFGGNEDDDGSQDNPHNWWGNLDEADTAKQYRSETQNLLQSIPATVNNLKRIGKAAERDLAFFVSTGAASAVNVVVGMPGLNKVSISCSITAKGKETDFIFIENWKAAA